MTTVFGPYGIIGGVEGHQRFTAHVPEPTEEGSEDERYIAGGMGTVVPVTFVCECGAGFRSRKLLAKHVELNR